MNDPFLSTFHIECDEIVSVAAGIPIHSLCYWTFATDLMFLLRSDFNGLCLNAWLDIDSSAAFFASSSARSFPSISAYPYILISMLLWFKFFVWSRQHGRGFLWWLLVRTVFVAYRLFVWPLGWPCIYAMCNILGCPLSSSLQIVSLLILLWTRKDASTQNYENKLSLLSSHLVYDLSSNCWWRSCSEFCHP